MSNAKVLGKSILLIILILVLVLFGLLWFDYLGIIHAKRAFSPLFKLAGLSPQTSVSASSSKELVEADLDNDRFAKRLEALDIRSQELAKRESEVKEREDANAQIAQELEDKEKTQAEREKTFNNLVKKYDDRSVNIEQIVANLNGMPPKSAVGILIEMDDQDVIDVLRRADEIAAASGESSAVAYWLSLMPSDRAAEISRKMANKPLSIN
ncbi:MAG: flagellar protein FlbB [Treponema succinifaciens]|uniref:periplasmic-type flagellar collar protein FlbB n=1 Tax=Treponema TaxID=157 RepID=UPI0023F2C19D|nr:MULTISPECIES: flagellar protein FlbB [Treponema]MDD6962931.1 flagellar protein FlbB [Treponema succinifaciens]MDY5117568.1 flagellar protein FlbB [Treponema succinifaciens]